MSPRPRLSVYPSSYCRIHIYHTLNKDNKRSLLILKVLWTLISQEEKDTCLPLGVCSTHCFCRSAKEGRACFQMASLVVQRRAPAEIERSFEKEETPEPWVTLPPFLFQEKDLQIQMSLGGLSKAAFDRCYLREWKRAKDGCTALRHHRCRVRCRQISLMLRCTWDFFCRGLL